MNHRWKKINADDVSYVLHDEDDDEYHHYPKVNKECVRCGLRRGTINTMGFFPRTVYFRGHTILSIDRVPSPCLDINFHVNVDFISVEEMLI
jgi:hypothetical protein